MAAMIIRRICDPKRSSIMFVAADTARGRVHVYREFLVMFILEIARQCCVQVCVLRRAGVCMSLALFCANLVTPAILC